MNWILHAVMALLLVWSGYLTRPRVHGNPLGLDTPGFKLWAGSTLLFIFAVKKNPGVEVVIEALYSAVLLGLIVKVLLDRRLNHDRRSLFAHSRAMTHPEFICFLCMLGVALTVTVVRAVNGIQIEDGLYTAYFAIASWVSGGRWSIATDRRRYVLLTLGLLALVYGSRFLISGSYESLSPVTWQHPCFYLSLFVLLYFVGDAEVNDTRLRA